MPLRALPLRRRTFPSPLAERSLELI